MITIKERAMIDNAVIGEPCSPRRSMSGRWSGTAAGTEAWSGTDAPLPTRNMGCFATHPYASIHAATAKQRGCINGTQGIRKGVLIRQYEQYRKGYTTGQQSCSSKDAQWPPAAVWEACLEPKWPWISHYPHWYSCSERVWCLLSFLCRRDTWKGPTCATL